MIDKGEKEMNSLKLSIREYMGGKSFSVDISDTRQSVIRPLRKILSLLSDIEDPRQEGKICYSLSSILLMIFVATLGGSDNCVQVKDFWLSPSKRRILKRLFKKDDVPSDDTFRRILSLLDTKEVDTLFKKVICSALDNLRKVFKVDGKERRQLAVDGKVMRGTGRKRGTDEEQRDLQILNVYDKELDTVICSCPIEEKRNEIPSAQMVLGKMNLKDTTVTFDAMNMQKETVRIISNQGGDWLGGLKGNHSFIENWCSEFFTRGWTEKHKDDNKHHIHTSEIAHNNLEERDFYFHLLTKHERETTFDGWTNARGLLCCEKHIINNVTGTESWDTHFYMTSLKSIEDASISARGHWGCEIEHWFLDTVMKEDSVALVDRQAATNYSILLKCILALYKRIGQMTHDGAKTVSMARIRKMFMFNFDEMMAKMLAMFDEKTLTEALSPQKRKKASV